MKEQYYEQLALDSSFDESHKRKALANLNSNQSELDKGFKIVGGGPRKHSVAGSGGTSS